jgi:hypothetical protein
MENASEARKKVAKTLALVVLTFDDALQLTRGEALLSCGATCAEK